MGNRTYQRYAEKKVGSNNKFYAVEVEELEDDRAKWIFRWGRIGTDGGKPKEGISYSFEGAKSICDAQFAKKKRQSGYVEVNAMQALASAVEELHERQANGLPPVEMEFSNFFAGKSEGRCHQLCQKWLDKLNIVRGSKHDLGFNAYEKQIEAVLKGFCKAWARIRKTKAHRHLEDNAHAHTAFRLTFKAFKDASGIPIYGYYQGVGTSW